MGKAWFAHDAAYPDSKDLAKRTQPDKVLKNKAFEIVNNPKYDGYQRGLASMFYKFFDKKSKGTGLKMKSRKMNNYPMNFISQLLESLEK